MKLSEYISAAMHQARVEAYALALFDAGPTPANCEMEQRFRQNYRETAERKVTEYERHGLFLAGTELVA